MSRRISSNCFTEYVRNLLQSFAHSIRKKDGMTSLVEHLALGLMQSWIELYMMHIRLTSKALTHQKMYQCLRYTAWIKAYASKLALGGFQCSGLSVPDFPELRFYRTRIFSHKNEFNQHLVTQCKNFFKLGYNVTVYLALELFEANRP